MDIDLLKTFLEVNKTRHFGHAADNLYLTSAAVSARVKQLESQLGVQLFLRHRGNIQLTGAGERLVPHSETMLHAWARTVQEVQLQPELDLRMHIGATSGLWLLAMEQKLQEVIDTFPMLAIQAEGHSSDDLVRQVLDRSLDFVLLYGPPATSELKSEKIGRLRLKLASSKPDVKLRQALTEDYVYVDWGTEFSMFHAKKFGERISSRVSVNLTHIALNLLQSRGGSAFFANSTIETEDWLYAVKGAPIFTRPVYVSYRVSNENIEQVKSVVETLRGLEV
ncbi:MAG: DNA-binding transcriptional LysR family regulator [Candidatus Azotimanducaceae bacterium]|jgi:DNA-binding transcriptional LysR family regulator